MEEEKEEEEQDQKKKSVMESRLRDLECRFDELAGLLVGLRRDIAGASENLEITPPAVEDAISSPSFEVIGLGDPLSAPPPQSTRQEEDHHDPNNRAIRQLQQRLQEEVSERDLLKQQLKETTNENLSLKHIMRLLAEEYLGAIEEEHQEKMTALRRIAGSNHDVAIDCYNQSCELRRIVAGLLALPSVDNVQLNILRHRAGTVFQQIDRIDIQALSSPQEEGTELQSIRHAKETLH